MEVRIRFGEATVHKPEDNVLPVRSTGEAFDVDDDEAFLEQRDEADRQAAALIREALPDHIGRSAPIEELRAAAARIREGIAKKDWPFDWIARGTGLSGGQTPRDDAELVLRCLSGLISLEDETGLESELDASIMTIEHADWLGAAVMLARAGAGTRADAAAFVKAIGDCPEVDGDVDSEDDELLEHSFEILLPAFRAIGLVDDRDRLTELGVWVLPRAVAQAWNGDFDATD